MSYRIHIYRNYYFFVVVRIYFHFWDHYLKVRHTQLCYSWFSATSEFNRWKIMNIIKSYMSKSDNITTYVLQHIIWNLSLNDDHTNHESIDTIEEHTLGNSFMRTTWRTLLLSFYVQETIYYELCHKKKTWSSDYENNDILFLRILGYILDMRSPYRFEYLKKCLTWRFGIECYFIISKKIIFCLTSNICISCFGKQRSTHSHVETLF